jgi:diguanylate cyclase (GGDEF)-like protein
MSASARVWALVSGLALVALSIIFSFRDANPVVSDVELRWWMLAPAFILVEILVVHLDVQREAQTISLSEVPIVIGLFFAAPVELIAAQALGAGVALLFFRRQPVLKAAFNLAQFAVVTGVTVAIFRALVPDDDASVAAWLAALAATVAADILAAILVSTAIALVEGGMPLPRMREFVGFGNISTIANTGLGLLGVELIRVDPVGALLLIVPVAVTYIAYRSFWRERQRSEHFAFLYESMRRLSAGRDIETAVHQLLVEARSMFRAETAAVVLAGESPDERARRSVLGPSGMVEMLVPLAVGDPAARAPADPRLESARAGGHPQFSAVLGREARDAMTIALRGESRTIGVMTVADREGDVNTFTRADLQFLQTFAAHAGVALENRDLQHSLGEMERENAELSERAHNDVLTGLPNRALFMERVETALETRRQGDGDLIGVLFVDVDDFKTVNDTLGHQAGDRVLVAFAERLRACLRPGDIASRFGGDEFTVLLDGITDVGEAEAVSDRLLAALAAPVSLGDREIPVRASIGVAVGVRDTESADALLRRADSGMYVAKSHGKGQWAPAPEASV